MIMPSLTLHNSGSVASQPRRSLPLKSDLKPSGSSARPGAIRPMPATRIPIDRERAPAPARFMEWLLSSGVVLIGESQLLLLVVPRRFFPTAQGRVTNMGGSRGGHADADGRIGLLPAADAFQPIAQVV